jgi:hypothetical protein
VASRKRVITLRMQQPDDLFQLPTTDLFSEYRNYRTGVDSALSELRRHRSRDQVELHIVLPAAKIRAGLANRMTRALHDYCDQRILFNNREKGGVRRDGFTAFWIGIPVTVVGLWLTFWTASADYTEGVKTVLDHLGWVVAWVGLWFPLDVILFSPHQYNRENRSLRALRDATIRLKADDPAVGKPGGVDLEPGETDGP